MTRRVRTMASTLFLGVVLAACSGPDVIGGGVDADAEPGNGDGGSIGGQLDSGIRLVFEPNPDFGETFEHNGNSISLNSAEFVISDLRLIGDAASGDERTSKSLIDLDWISNTPISVDYEDAPPGLYSRVRGTVVAFSIRGDVSRAGGQRVEFEVEDDTSSLPFEIPLDFTLEPGEVEVVRIDVDLQNMTEEIPFENLEVDDGVIEVDDDSDAMDKAEEKIVESFKLGG